MHLCKKETGHADSCILDSNCQALYLCFFYVDKYTSGGILNIILCIWCNAMCLCFFKVKKTHDLLYCTLLLLRLSEMRKFKKMSSFWEARFALIGQLSSTLWLAKYLKRETEMLLSLPYCDAVLQTKSTTLCSSKLTFESSVAHSEAPDCPCKVVIAPLYKNSLWT